MEKTLGVLMLRGPCFWLWITIERFPYVVQHVQYRHKNNGGKNRITNDEASDETDKKISGGTHKISLLNIVSDECNIASGSNHKQALHGPFPIFHYTISTPFCH